MFLVSCFLYLVRVSCQFLRVEPDKQGQFCEELMVCHHLNLKMTRMDRTILGLTRSQHPKAGFLAVAHFFTPNPESQPPLKSGGSFWMMINLTTKKRRFVNRPIKNAGQ